MFMRIRPFSVRHREVPRSLSSLGFRWLLLPCLGVMAALAAIDTQLKGEHAPHGIVSFEFCVLSKSCEALLGGWSGVQREFAMLSLGVDYLFLVLYPAVIASALLLVAARLPERLRSATRFWAGLMLVAGVADAAENFCLVWLLRTGDVSTFGQPAAAFASAKFTIIGLALIWLATAYAISLRSQSDA